MSTRSSVPTASGSISIIQTPKTSECIIAHSSRKDHEEQTASPTPQGGLAFPKATTPEPQFIRRFLARKTATAQEKTRWPILRSNNFPIQIHQIPLSLRNMRRRKPNPLSPKNASTLLSRMQGRRKQSPVIQASRCVRNPLLTPRRSGYPLPQRVVTGFVRRWKK